MGFIVTGYSDGQVGQAADSVGRASHPPADYTKMNTPPATRVRTPACATSARPQNLSMARALPTDGTGAPSGARQAITDSAEAATRHQQPEVRRS